MWTKLYHFLVQFINDERGTLDLLGGGGEPGGTDPGSSEPSGEPNGGGEPGTLDPEGPQGAIDFPEGLEEDIQNDPSLKVFIKDNKLNYANLVKSYVHAQKKMGDKGVRLPDNHSTEEDWNNFYNMLRPSEMDKYELKNSLPEGTPLDENMFNGFRENAHKLGLSTKQAQTMLDWYNETTNSVQSQAKETQEANYAREVKGLREEWGEGFDKEMNLAQRAIKEFADEKDVEFLKESGLAGNVNVIKLFNKIGKGLLEDKFDQESHGSFGVTKDDAQNKINSIMGDMSHPYFDSKHPSHKNAVDEVNKLYSALT